MFIEDRVNNNFATYYDVIIYDDITPPIHTDYIIMMNKVFEDLSQIKFYKSHGVFMKNPPEYKPIEEMRTLFTHPNIKLIDTFCCVCLEHCNSKTHCNHLLCYVCWGKIHKTMECEYCDMSVDANEGCFGDNYNNIEGIEEIRKNCNKRRCPYCRENI